MEITSETDGDLVQFHFVGRLDTVTSPTLAHAVSVAMQQGGRRLIFDLSNVSYVSSAGLRGVLIAAKQAKSAGGGVAVFGLQANVAQVFALSGFDKVLAIAATGEAARERLPATQG